MCWFGMGEKGYMMKKMMKKEIRMVNLMGVMSWNVVGVVVGLRGMG